MIFQAEYVSKFLLSTVAFSNFFARPLPSFKELEEKASETSKRCPSTKFTSDIEPQTKVIDLTEDDDLLRTDGEFGEQEGELPDKRSSTGPNDETGIKKKQNTGSCTD